MKPNRPSLILFFVSIVLTVVFRLLDYDDLVVCMKTIALPSIFIYFFVTNNYKISRINGFIFLFCFIGDVVNLMDSLYSNVVSAISFLIVYSLLLRIVFEDCKTIKYKKKDYPAILLVITIITILYLTIINLKFDNDYIFRLYVAYGIVLSVLSAIAYINYIIKPNYTYLFLILMVTSFIMSDIFYVFDRYYLNLTALELIRDVTQVLAYFFMVKYFLEKLYMQNRLNDY